MPLTGGGTESKLTDRLVAYFAEVSADGRQLLFDGAGPGVVTLCDLPGCGNPRQLPLPSARWGPDGKSVVFINEEDRGNLWVRPLDGGAPRPLTKLGDANILTFAFSSNRKHLAMLRGRATNDLVLVTGF